MKVFVYGTLKKGFGNHRRLEHVSKEKNGVLQNHMLYDSGFPVCTPHEGSSVTGEVYDIGDCQATLRSLDQLEGYRENDPDRSMYLRQSVTLEDGEEVQTYIGNPLYWSFDRMSPIKNVTDGQFTY